MVKFRDGLIDDLHQFPRSSFQVLQQNPFQFLQPKFIFLGIDGICDPICEAEDVVSWCKVDPFLFKYKVFRDTEWYASERQSSYFTGGGSVMQRRTMTGVDIGHFTSTRVDLAIEQGHKHTVG